MGCSEPVDYWSRVFAGLFDLFRDRGDLGVLWTELDLAVLSG